jgi:hypothetical protein
MSNDQLPGTPGATEADADEMGRAANAWRPVGPVAIHALSARVLVVAVKRVEGWAAYCDAVPGEDHGRELYKVAQTGSKIAEHVARVLFPQFADVPYCP